MLPRKQVNVLGSKSFMFSNVKEQILTLLMMLFDADADAHSGGMLLSVGFSARETALLSYLL